MKRAAMTLMMIGAAALVALPGAANAQDPLQVAKGATLYAQNCARCHNARAATERSDREWATIVFQMRARANLSKSQTEAILAFLQATNLPEPGAAASVANTPAPTTETRASEPEAKPAPERTVRGELELGVRAGNPLAPGRLIAVLGNLGAGADDS